MRTALLTLCLLAFISLPAQAQLPTSQLDDFNRTDANTLGNTPTSPTSLQWSEKGEAVASDATITAGETIRIENQTAFLQSGKKNGTKSAVVDLSSLSGYKTSLDNFSGVVTWAFNLRQSTAEPAGFAPGEVGAMFVLAGSSNDFDGSANSYAVVLGQDGSTDPLKLVRFNGGYSNEGDFVEIISGSTDRSNNYLSVRVTFDPSTKDWTLYAEGNSNDFPTSDPRTVTNSLGTASDDVGTGNQRKYLGFLLNHGDSESQTATFDDIYITDPNTRLPVELTEFDARTDDEAVQLTWRTASETNNAGFEVQRKRGSASTWTEVGFVEGHGTTSEPQRYRFSDADLPYEAETLTYRLKQVDLDGSANYSAEVEVALTAPERLTLKTPFPNPVESKTTIRYELPQTSRVQLAVYNMLGQRVATLASERQSEGPHTATFTPRDLPSGVYFVRLSSEGTTRTEKITVVR